MDDDLPRGLVEDCRVGKVVLFAGPGLAASTGLPTAKQLLRRILNQVGRTKPVEDLRAQIGTVEPSLIADVLQLRLNAQELQELSRLLERSLRRQAVPTLFRVLSEIPFAGVITTFRGTAIDRAFASRAPFVIEPGTGSLSTVLLKSRFFLLKAYGDLGEDGRMLFSFEEQFREVVSRNPEYRRFVSSVVTDGTLLFLGASPAGVRNFLGTVGIRSRPDRTHYALVPSNEYTVLEQERMDGLYNMMLLPCDATARDRELDRFVRRLSNSVRQDVEPALRPEVLNEVTLKNIGPFTNLHLQVNDSWNVLLSDNGFGKSSVLRAIALALCGDDERAEYAATSLLRSGTTEGSIELRAGKSRYITRLVRDRNNRVLVEPDAITPVQGGAWLALGFPSLRGVSYSRIDGPSKLDEGAPNPVVEDLLPLVDPNGVDSRLDDLRQWVVNASFSAGLDKAEGGPPKSANRLDSFFKIVQRLTPGLPFKFKGIDPDTWETMVETEDGKVIIPVQRLSQGITSLLTWVGTLLERLYEVYGESQHPESEKALVLVDEIDAHLHPAWQQQVIPLLRDVFPNLQVLATTHSPLIVGNLQPPQTSCYRLLRDKGSVTAEPVPIESFRGWRADQILTGPAFDLASTRDQATRALMDEYSSLLGIPEPTKSQRDRLAQLSSQLELDVPSHEETEEARQAAELFEEWLQERLHNLPMEKKQKLVKEAELYLIELRRGESDASR